jgi:hypothetical protein
MGLDEKAVSEKEQDIYLRHKGFLTGEQVPYGEICRKYRMPQEAVKSIIAKVERLCTS